MSRFELSRRSENRIDGVIPLHPSLAKVVRKAITIATTDFGVGEVGRSIERQLKLVDDGLSTTMNSKHLKQKDGYSHAVDLYVYNPAGEVTWEHKHFRPIVQAMFTAAIEEGVQIRAGCLWRNFQDSPHFEVVV